MQTKNAHALSVPSLSLLVTFFTLLVFFSNKTITICTLPASYGSLLLPGFIYLYVYLSQTTGIPLYRYLLGLMVFFTLATWWLAWLPAARSSISTLSPVGNFDRFCLTVVLMMVYVSQVAPLQDNVFWRTAWVSTLSAGCVALFKSVSLVVSHYIVFLIALACTAGVSHCVQYFPTSLFRLQLTNNQVIVNGQDKNAAEVYVYLSIFFLFCGVSLLSNLLVIKHIDILGFRCTASVVTYCFIFVCSDAAMELYGKQLTQTIVWGGFLCDVVFLSVLTGLRLLPLAVGQGVTEAKAIEFMSMSIIASMVAYLCSQLTDLYIFDLLRKATRGRHLWLRNNVATLTSQLLDTCVYALVCWVLWTMSIGGAESPLTQKDWYTIARNEYVVKVLFSLLDTPMVYLVVYLLRRKGASPPSIIRNP